MAQTLYYKFINFHSSIQYKFQLSSFLVLLVGSETERRCCSTRYYALPLFCWDIYLFHWLSFSPHYLGLNEFVQNLFEKLKNWMFSESWSPTVLPCPILFCSWNRSRGKKLATFLPTYSSWYCKWNTYSFTKGAVCCIYNMVRYVNCCLIYGSFDNMCQNSNCTQLKVK